MKVEGSYTFDAPRERVWSTLLNPDSLKSCIPGCDSMNPTGEDQYEVSMKVGVAAIRNLDGLADTDQLVSLLSRIDRLVENISGKR